MAITPQELRDLATEEHSGRCLGRKFACTCDHEAKVDRALRAAAKRIDELEATNRGYRELEALRRETERREQL